MKTFRQFSEEWNRGDERNTVEHSATVGKHQVHVVVTHKENKGHVGIDFLVNHSYNKEDVSSKDGAKILHHVHKIVKHYVEKRKPHTVHFSGNNDEKDQMYRHYANRLAKQFGGRTKKIIGGVNVHMDKNK